MLMNLCQWDQTGKHPWSLYLEVFFILFDIWLSQDLVFSSYILTSWNANIWLKDSQNGSGKSHSEYSLEINGFYCVWLSVDCSRTWRTERWRKSRERRWERGAGPGSEGSPGTPSHLSDTQSGYHRSPHSNSFFTEMTASKSVRTLSLRHPPLLLNYIK